MSRAGEGVNALGARREGGQIAYVPRHTTSLEPLAPMLLVDRFTPLHAELIALLRGLRPEDWQRPTACALWSVHDLVAHLLDDDLRRLSFHRDEHAVPAGAQPDHVSLVAL